MFVSKSVHIGGDLFLLFGTAAPKLGNTEMTLKQASSMSSDSGMVSYSELKCFLPYRLKINSLLLLIFFLGHVFFIILPVKCLLSKTKYCLY